MESRFAKAIQKINLKKRYSSSGNNIQTTPHNRQSISRPSDAFNIQENDGSRVKLNENQQSYLSNILFKLKFKQQIKNIINTTSKRRLENLNYKFLNDLSTADYTNNVEALYLSKQKSQIYKNNIVDMKERLSKMPTQEQRNGEGDVQLLRRFCFQNFRIPIFNRSNNFKLMWDLIVNLCILVIIFFIPIMIIYNYKLNQILDQQQISIICLILFFNCLVSLNTSIYKKGREQKNRREIAIDYIKKSFFIDILPIFCLYLIIFFQANDIDVLYINLFLVLFIPKSMNLLRFLDQLEESFSLNRKIVNVIQLAQLLFLILFVAHIFASFWLYIGIHPIKENDTTWLTVAHLKSSNWSAQYVKSYYYATVTMITVGYGDIVPSNDNEAIFVIFSTIICCGVFAYALNQVGKIILNFLFCIKSKFQNKQVKIRFMNKQIKIFSLKLINQYQISHFYNE